MGKIIFTPVQKLIFDEFARNDALRKTFYFTGGTALSVFHFQHRYSDDLDFFSEKDFPDELIDSFIHKITQKLNLMHRYTRIEGTRMFEFVDSGKLIIKVDFGYYPYKRLAKGFDYQGVTIDSLLDIGSNKMVTINQRQSAKDYVDLYYLLQPFTVWDLLYGVEKKFRREIDVMLVASDLLGSRELEIMPKMIKPLTLGILKTYFSQKAREIAGRVVKR